MPFHHHPLKHVITQRSHGDCASYTHILHTTSSSAHDPHHPAQLNFSPGCEVFRRSAPLTLLFTATALPDHGSTRRPPSPNPPAPFCPTTTEELNECYPSKYVGPSVLHHPMSWELSSSGQMNSQGANPPLCQASDDIGSNSNPEDQARTTEL